MYIMNIIIIQYTSYNVFHFSLGCPRLSSPSNGFVNFGTSTARYGCNSGYTLVGSSTRTCTSGGYWSGSTPYCRVSSGTFLAGSLLQQIFVNTMSLYMSQWFGFLNMFCMEWYSDWLCRKNLLYYTHIQLYYKRFSMNDRLCALTNWITYSICYNQNLHACSELIKTCNIT